MRQMTQENPLLPKHNGQRQFLRPLSGKHDLVTMEGQLWKTWRTIFNPGFSANHLMTLVPTILEDVSIFYGILRGHAEKGDLFSLEEATLSVTLDVIGRVTLNSQFNVQTTYNDMTSALRNQILWCTFGLEPNPLTHINPIRPIMQWYNTRRMNRYINRELENSYAANRGESADKSIVGLALKSYLDESPGTKRDQGMDATFKEFARSQIKVFLFAGHDTTASTICYIYHLLSLNPAALEQVRAEHDTVFGKDLAPVISLITSKPHLLNQLPYTLAVIKESLRLFPVVTIPRAGKSGLFLTDSDGCKYPTKDCLVWGNHHALHRNPLWWPQPNDFIPERWLVAEDDPLHPVKNAWRPFEWGPRNCIGQELALLEMKMIAVLTLREFNVTGVYEEWDQLHGTTGANKTVDGERAYQIQLGSAHPSDGLPCRVKFA
ncbi:hypothetical protein MMC29_000336 [Sticta canariensis]|nr:hypothetical protein [Sticta canariensis]